MLEYILRPVPIVAFGIIGSILFICRRSFGIVTLPDSDFYRLLRLIREQVPFDEKLKNVCSELDRLCGILEGRPSDKVRDRVVAVYNDGVATLRDYVPRLEMRERRIRAAAAEFGMATDPIPKSLEEQPVDWLKWTERPGFRYSTSAFPKNLRAMCKELKFIQGCIKETRFLLQHD